MSYIHYYRRVSLFSSLLRSKSVTVSCTRTVTTTISDDKYPKSMDLGTKFYDNLLSSKNVMERRKENQTNYPNKNDFLSLIPKTPGTADGHQFKIYWDGVFGMLPSLPVEPDLLLHKFIEESDPD